MGPAAPAVSVTHWTVQFACEVTYPFADTTKMTLSSRQRAASGAQVPQNRSGTLRCRTLSASDALGRSAETRTMTVRMDVARGKTTLNFSAECIALSSPRSHGWDTRQDRGNSPRLSGLVGP